MHPAKETSLQPGSEIDRSRFNSIFKAEPGVFLGGTDHRTTWLRPHSRSMEERAGTGFSPVRLESFSDGVFAVAITLLVLSIKLPDRRVADDQLWQAIVALGPNFFAYVLSFVIIGTFWMGHHRLFSVLKRHDAGLLWLNMLFLMLIVFIPFPTLLMSEYSDVTAATAFYAGSLAAASLALCLVAWYAFRGNRLVADDFDPQVGWRMISQYLNMFAVFSVSIGIAFINNSAAQYSWLLIWVNSIIIERLQHRKGRGSTPAESG